MKQKKFLLSVLIILATLISGCDYLGVQQASAPTPTPTQSYESFISPQDIEVGTGEQAGKQQSSDELMVRVLDVNHGDATLVMNTLGDTMLIDTGEYGELPMLRNGLQDAGVTDIDVLVLTHPHSDHIGNARWVLRNYPVGEVYMIEKAHTTKIYTELLDSLQESNVVVNPAAPGEKFTFADAQCEYLGPLNLNMDLNNCSAIMRMTYGENTFLFTGDCEYKQEDTLLKEYDASELKSDFLKVGHHATSSTQDAFAKAVRPQVSVISSLNFNTYSEPEHKQAVVDRLEKLGSQVYVTGMNGSVSVYTDGKKMRVVYQRENKQDK